MDTLYHPIEIEYCPYCGHNIKKIDVKQIIAMYNTIQELFPLIKIKYDVNKKPKQNYHCKNCR